MPTAFHAMTLVATIRAAYGASRSVADRRAGREPSAQESEDVARLDLDALRADLRALVVQLRLRAVADAPDSEAAALAQAFEDHVLVDDLGGAVRRAHQKLLSLYPAVPEGVVEEARRLATAAAEEIDADRPALGDLARRVADWLDALADVLDA
ncbi:hypothetical protein RQM47_03505 [Rubrivirga sp. S365]|uniref:Uncharacterized protein n=1 Tax=Rubrivirga litoralis TaxID=3075598 RepID=A0ABU3BLM6_9BACT|nr:MULTISPECIES: hypothetical protein [unclassified Rubrivirga]MDT0630188.1 hypothetical protein [Rubrivirga sp. F394]MDT7855699.1 hypothetical protein [Rubrivirga sp. S365]